LLTYPDRTKINELFDEVASKRAEYEFTTTYRDTHYLWKVDRPEQLALIQQEFAEVDSLYIADGHHRSASSHRLVKELEKQNPDAKNLGLLRNFMVYTIPESELRISEFNRV